VPKPVEAARESDRLDPSIWKIGSVAVLGSFLAQLDATVVNVSLSSLAVTLHSSLSAIQWVTSGYLLALALMLPLSGWMVDRIGAKALYLCCFSAFTLSSALCGFSCSANSLIGFRILQGMSAGPLAPMAQMMMARAAGKRMACVLGVAAMPILLAQLLGPVTAGAILQFASWRWLFLVNLPVGVLALVLAVLFLPNDREETKPRDLDLIGWALLSPGLVLFLYGSDHIRDRIGIVSLAGSILLLTAFFRWATRKKDKALIDLRLFKGKVFSVCRHTIHGEWNLIRRPDADSDLSYPRWGTFSQRDRSAVGSAWTGDDVRLPIRRNNRKVSAGGASLALSGTLPFIYIYG
jgi:EmrB/QacA subfamily drug resistance transporter